MSRVPPVHTAIRNCRRDEGGPLEIGNQVLISSHRKLLLPKAMVVSVLQFSNDRSVFVRHDASPLVVTILAESLHLKEHAVQTIMSRAQPSVMPSDG